MPPGIVPNAVSRQLCASLFDPVFLTPCKKCQCDQCAELGLEALEERCNGDEVEDHVEEVEMHNGEQIESVHCK